MRSLVFIATAFAIAACGQEAPPAQVEAPDRLEAVEAANVPPEVVAVALATLPGFTITEAERKERDGRIYYDVEGVRADGAEAELDMLQTANGWQVVEIQRDIAWADAPANVRTMAAGAPNAFEPVRVIESTQTEDGAVIYELFAEGRPEAPSMEVRVVSGAPELMTAANPH
jgi:predicted small lipoprotein YifL